jgi:hypothetical protein
VIADASWKFVAITNSTPAQFEIPYQAGTAIQISGRSANVNNLEASPDLCPITRLTLGGGNADVGIPGIPEFSLATTGNGEVTLSQIGFTDLTNTASVTSGTLELAYWNELLAMRSYALAAALDATTQTIQLVQVASPNPGAVIQLGSELMSILSVNSPTNTYNVVRGVLSSVAATHNVGDNVLHLASSNVIVPFAQGYFENRASLNYLHTFDLPDVRICAAAFFVSNSFGSGQSNQECYTTLTDGGIRTLSGGQFSIQVSGYLATQQNAAPPLLVEASHAVEDVRAIVNQAATGYTIVVDVLQNGAEYCQLQIPDGATTSNVIDGATLPALAEGASLTINITLNVDPNKTASISPGRDLTVTIRL